MDLSQAETKLPELQLQRKQSENQRKEQKRSLQRSDKNSMEQMLANTEADAVLSTRESLSQRGKKRKIQYFEDREEAQQRAKKRKEMEESGERKKKRHSPDPSTLNFDKEGLLETVRQMRHDDVVSLCAQL